MKKRVLYIERKPSEYVSLEKVFRQIARSLPSIFATEFQQVPFGPKPFDTLRNFLFFRKQKADIYHITGHINYIALVCPPKNTVLSIMDLRFLFAKGRLRRYVLKKLYLDLPVRRLKFITAISEHTKREIVDNTHCDPAKIQVLDLPLIGNFSPRTSRPFNKQKPVLLQVGTMPNKNILNLAPALSGINCILRIVGRLSSEHLQALESNEITFENVFDLTDEQMINEYQNADMITFCSTYEGFGLPIIEGQAAGKPVITSNISPMTETSGSAACLADPHDVASIRSGILRIINDEAFRHGLVEAGIQNIQRFDPEIIGKKYADLYGEILAGVESR